jgi:hypothetical protein
VKTRSPSNSTRRHTRPASLHMSTWLAHRPNANRATTTQPQRIVQALLDLVRCEVYDSVSLSNLGPPTAAGFVGAVYQCHHSLIRLARVHGLPVFRLPANSSAPSSARGKGRLSASRVRAADSVALKCLLASCSP